MCPDVFVRREVLYSAGDRVNGTKLVLWRWPQLQLQDDMAGKGANEHLSGVWVLRLCKQAAGVTGRDDHGVPTTGDVNGPAEDH